MARAKSTTKITKRNSDGTFAKGNIGGPGRPARPTEENYLRATVALCSIDDWKEIIKTAVAHAKGGDHRARQFLADILLKNAPSIFEMEANKIAGTDPLKKEVERKLSRSRKELTDDILNRTTELTDVEYSAKILAADVKDPLSDVTFDDAFGHLRNIGNCDDELAS